ncbi:putative S-adenosyl-L-methionine-dependent methyltransferase [Helianthus annuus]|nr:putative S-adenosyl-L-methionine-dependent methyltransferase [Helianthus annuus]
MEKHIQIFLHKISYLSITIATLTLILVFFFQPLPETCINPNPNHPKSSCSAAHRRTTTVGTKNHRLWSTNSWTKHVNSFSTLFTHLQTLKLINNHTQTLILSAGGGQAVMALKQIGLVDVVGVELVDSPPLVSRGDPHNLPFFDTVFDLGFSVNLDQALFPARYVRELERVVRVGGVVVVCVEECGESGVREVLRLFGRSEVVRVGNVTVVGSKMTMIVTRRTISVCLRLCLVMRFHRFQLLTMMPLNYP